MSWYSRRTYGVVLDDGLAMLHNRRVLMRSNDQNLWMALGLVT